MQRTSNTVLTIGHSIHPAEVFLKLLVQHQVTALADVRSAPYSRFNPQFNRKRLAESLKAADIKYVYLGEELGGRAKDPACYENGRIRYDRVACSQRFQSGLTRVVDGANSHRIALMCAEKEPLHCHRTLLVGHELDKVGMNVAHILADGQLETHENAMNRLLSEFNLEPEGDLLSEDKPRIELVEEAIRCQTQLVGHSLK